MNCHTRNEQTYAKYIRQCNSTRTMLRMPELKPKVRSCLKCDKKFPSESAGNRMCDQCKNVGKYSYSVKDFE